jgi:hypothetical protein
LLNNIYTDQYNPLFELVTSVQEGRREGGQLGSGRDQDGATLSSHEFMLAIRSTQSVLNHGYEKGKQIEKLFLILQVIGFYFIQYTSFTSGRRIVGGNLHLFPTSCTLIFATLVFYFIFSALCGII